MCWCKAARIAVSEASTTIAKGAFNTDEAVADTPESTDDTTKLETITLYSASDNGYCYIKRNGMEICRVRVYKPRTPWHGEENAMEISAENDESVADTPESADDTTDVEPITLFLADNGCYYIQEEWNGNTPYDEGLIMIPFSCETTYIDILPESCDSDETIEKSNMRTPIESAKYMFTNLGLQRVTQENATEASDVNYESKLWSPVSSASPNCPGGGVFYAGNSNITSLSNEMTTIDVPSSSCNCNGLSTMINSSDNCRPEHKQIIYLKASSRPTSPTACFPASDNTDSPPIPSTSSLNPAAKNSSEKKYACHICDKVFIWPSSVKRHVDTHFPERFSKCPLCGKSFSRLSDMQRHVREHNREKPLSCNVCKKRFLREFHLRRHITVHSNEKPFQCAVCKKNLIKLKAVW
ncbi:hypothetical protein CEXT_107061 [Caerostris extrusa]|uniref:C2H2-type domain-containing protein n=1 Tax=Caerostris extrusa TaxID=172846 RepID=A0AAV4NKQ7_CAEEX|nr:hypothetical protein CEXT_107061 [Caerostris extrusa]